MSLLAIQVGLQGIYQLNTPFAELLQTNVVYTCVAIRKFEDITAEGGDPYELYYRPVGLPIPSYKSDLDAKVNIVSIQASNGAIIHVPDSYILSMPVQDGIPYHVLALGISLSALPDTTDLAYVKDKIKEVVIDTLGVTSEVKELVISPLLHLSKSEHAVIESARQANITSSTTDFSKLLEMTRQRDAALLKIQELEAYIKTKL